MAKTPESRAPPVSPGNVICPLFASPISAGRNNKWKPSKSAVAVRWSPVVQAQTAMAKSTSTGSGVRASDWVK
eukprot:4842953-Amphidinium_carterae.2